jgi:hypothetical protein
MGFEETMRVQGPATWTAASGRDYARPGTGQRQPAPSHPAEARTPREALSYIKVLYKSGRMEELATLLRSRAVFREAWLMLQQSSRADFPEAAAGGGPAGPKDTESIADLPVPLISPSRFSPNPESPGAEAAPELPARAPNPAPAPGLPPPGQAGYLLRKALGAYQSQDGFFSREPAGSRRLSLRV